MRLFAGLFVAMLTGVLALVVWARTEPARQLAAAEARIGATIEPGDVVFQDLRCGVRCELIREITHGRYVHVGLVLGEGDRRVVWEAFEPVGPTPLAEWIDRGVNHDVAVYRLAPELRAQLPRVEQRLRSMQGRPYDGAYQWDDERIYCSELVVKAVSEATGVSLFEPHALGAGAFGASRQRIERMTHGVLTEQTLLVSPVDLTRSVWLRRIGDELAEHAGR
jgi:hypothetical protein